MKVYKVTVKDKMNKDFDVTFTAKNIKDLKRRIALRNYRLIEIIKEY